MHDSSRYASGLGVILLVGAVAGMIPGSAAAQSVPWDTFTDAASSSVCDVVNTSNAELVVLTTTGELVIVSGRDTVLVDTRVTEEGDVLLNGSPVGFISFAEDEDGFRTLWWTSLTGRVVEVDGFTGEPTETDRFPDDFQDVPCDACPLWDDPTTCLPSNRPPVVIRLCGNEVVVAMVMMTGGLLTLRLVHSNRNRSRRGSRTRNGGDLGLQSGAMRGS